MRSASLVFLYLLGCGAGPSQLLALVAQPGSELPAELIGEFRCTSATYRSRLTIRADGRYREAEVLVLLRDRFRPLTVAEPPCDPLGWVSYRDGALQLDYQPASCEALGDPVTLPRYRRSFQLVKADADGFSSSEMRCQRVR